MPAEPYIEMNYGEPTAMQASTRANWQDWLALVLIAPFLTYQYNGFLPLYIPWTTIPGAGFLCVFGGFDLMCQGGDRLFRTIDVWPRDTYSTSLQRTN